jgi:diaminohydroxyphosphoribosylaminopyrimidine deaminase/5-amino-6-(5-phosphoribosylamino)uracil reductase
LFKHIPVLVETFMRRCFDLARLGEGRVSPNPMVGAVLAHDGRIIGEGHHQAYGLAHAEVNAINAVLPVDAPLIPRSTLYVSLEPCCIHGRTPPCVDLILARRIPRVVISCLDETPEVAGRGLALLRSGGVEIVAGVLEEDGKRLTAPRATYVVQQRPYIILKFARGRDGAFCPADGRQQWLTNAYSRRLTHKWRAETGAILVGAGTAAIDDPQLTNRLYFGSSPLRVVVDRHNRLPERLRIFDDEAPTLLVSPAPPAFDRPRVEWLSFAAGDEWLSTLMAELHRRGINKLMVEGGRAMIELFVDRQLWDEARVLTADAYIPQGLPAPVIPGAPDYRRAIDNDLLEVYFRP